MANKTFTAAQKAQTLSPNFKMGDFWSNDRYPEVQLETMLADVFEKFYRKFNIKPRMANANHGKSAAYKPTTTAGYRVPIGDKKRPYGDWGGSKTSAHCFGCAVDVEVPGVSAYKLAQFAETLPEIAGIGLYGDNNGHIHIDYIYNKKDNPKGRKKRTCWWVLTKNSKTPGFGGIATVFKKGHRSKAIEDIQTKLNSSGYPCGKVDGWFGTNTKNALKKYQKAVKIKADGAYGKDTNAKMKLFDW